MGTTPDYWLLHTASIVANVYYCECPTRMRAVPGEVALYSVPVPLVRSIRRALLRLVPARA